LADQQTLIHLAKLLDVGLSPLEAVQRLRTICPDDELAISHMTRGLKLGRSIANVAHDAGFTSRLECEVLKVAENSGKLNEALHLIADNFHQRKKRTSALHTRLLLPNFIMLIILAISVVQALVTNSDIFFVLLKVILIMLFLLVFTKTLLSFVRDDATQWLSLGWRLGLQKSSILFRRYSEYTFFTLFSWQLEAGVDYISGAKTLETLINADSYRQQIRHYKKLVSEGNGVTDSLLSTDLMMPGELAQVVKTGEHSGRFSQSLMHFNIAEGLRLDQTTDTIFIWIPRIYYFVILVTGGLSIL